VQVPDELLAINNAPYTIVQDDKNVDPFALPAVASSPAPAPSADAGYDMMSSVEQCNLPSSKDICDASTASSSSDSSSSSNSNSSDNLSNSNGDVSTRRNLRVFKGII
jgi:hypothetical protein